MSILNDLPLQPKRLQLIGARKFLTDFKPIESIIDGLPVGRGAVVAITGPTGAGKTTVCAMLQVCLRMGIPFAGREVTAGSVLVLAGENPDDYAMHLMASLQQMGVAKEDLNDLTTNTNLMVVPGTFRLLDEIDHLHSMLAAVCENLVAVFVDTSAAFFAEADENDNVAMRRHASSLREFTTLPGNPTVFVLCHPTKQASADNLLPRGGGAFIAEIDANLTVFKDAAGIVALHWAGKIRGAAFDAIRFELVPEQLKGKVDSRGRAIFSVAVRHLADERAQQLEAKELDDENTLMLSMLRKPQAPIADLALACGWANGAGTPNKARVHRVLSALKNHGLTEQTRGRTWQLTSKGKKEAECLKV